MIGAKLIKTRKICAIAFSLIAFHLLSSFPATLDEIFFSDEFDARTFVSTKNISKLIHKAGGIINQRFHVVFGQQYPCGTGSDNGTKINVIFLIRTVQERFEQRRIIRTTWANSSLFQSCGYTSKALFIVGTVKDDANKVQTLRGKLRMEYSLYQDIVQFDFQEMYTNLDYEVVSALEFIAGSCPKTDFLVLQDDDYLVHPANLLKTISQVTEHQYPTYVLGHVSRGNKPVRNKTDKWYIPKKTYPFGIYPLYPTGGTIILSLPMARMLAFGMRNVKMRIFDDVLMGIVLKRLKVSVVDSPGIHSGERTKSDNLSMTVSSDGFKHTMLEGWKKIKDSAYCAHATLK
ncbi:unnamed protein product [Calicophoron daubneyi]|uniref:Hexosyltransferase n=1 Tax=Calicophoron daubneyi TaxID=300641 RepID=A0AAV2TM23_CALDB